MYRPGQGLRPVGEEMDAMTRKRPAADHLSGEQIQGFAETEPERAGDRAHLEHCARCAGELDRVRDLTRHLRAGRGAEPSAAAVERVIGLFPARPPLATRIVE